MDPTWFDRRHSRHWSYIYWNGNVIDGKLSETFLWNYTQFEKCQTNNSLSLLWSKGAKYKNVLGIVFN